MLEMQETQVQCLDQEDSPGGRNGNPLQYSCLKNLMDRGTWWATVQGTAESEVTEWLSMHVSQRATRPFSVTPGSEKEGPLLRDSGLRGPGSGLLYCVLPLVEKVCWTQMTSRQDTKPV